MQPARLEHQLECTLDTVLTLVDEMKAEVNKTIFRDYRTEEILDEVLRGLHMARISLTQAYLNSQQPKRVCF